VGVTVKMIALGCDAVLIWWIWTYLRRSVLFTSSG